MTTRESEAARVFDGPGELPELCMALDWAGTPLGPVASWPEALRTVVRTALESPFPINLWCGPDLVLIYNDAYRSVLGTKHPAALGRSGREVWREIWPDIEPIFDRIRAGGAPWYEEDQPFQIARAPDSSRNDEGPNAWFTFAVSPVHDDRGELVAVLNIVLETTKRVRTQHELEAARIEAEQAEARLREVFAHAPAFLVVLRGERHVVEYANAAYYELVGQRDIIGKPLFEALPDVRGQGFEPLLNDVLQHGTPFIGREVPITVVRDGRKTELFLDLVYFPIRDADGTPTGVVAHGSDVSAHVLARRDAQRARALAEQANQAKTNFLANMSHEIRTPINAVVGYTDLLELGVAGSLTQRQHEFVNRIRTSSKHLLGLVNDVLDLAKVEAGEMPVSMGAIPAAEVVDSALQIMVPQAQSAGITIETEWQCEPDLKLAADRDRVRQILLNLLSNALKFTPPHGHVRVRCRTAPEGPGPALPDAGPWVLVEVEDTGIGIAEDHLSRIFEPFVQADAGRTRQAGGTGLGLTISRRLARLMGGDITVRSELGSGSSFSLWLAPAAHERLVSAAAAWARNQDWPQEPQETPGLKDVGEVLYESTEKLQDVFVERVRSDAHLPGAKHVDRREIADHLAAVLSVMAKTLTELDTGVQVAALRESEEIQALLCAWHGRQRRRLGWSSAEMRREYEILHEILDGFLRREAPMRTVVDIGRALGIVHVLVDRAEVASMAAFAAGTGRLPGIA